MQKAEAKPGSFDWRCSGWADLHFPRVYHKANDVLDGELMKLGRDVPSACIRVN